MGRRVECEISAATLTNDDGREIDGVQAECSRCGHTTESFGTSDASVRRCLAIMREQCPEGEENFYVGESD